MKTGALGFNSTASALRRVSGGLISPQLCCAFALTLFLQFGASRANASVINYIYQSGSNVISSYSGSINTAALTAGGNGNCGPNISPVNAFECFDPSSALSVPLFSGFTGPSSFGPGSGAAASSQSGNPFAINGSGHILSVYSGYVSGTAISGSLTWDGTTLSGLGLTPGAYTYNWGSGVTADSIVVNVGVAPVPEPASLGLMSLVGLALMLLLLNRRASSV